MDNDALLLEKYARSRDAEAFAALADRYSAMVYHTAWRVLGNSHDAEEVTQECFLTLARKAATIRSSLPGWLHALAVSRARDLRRKKASRQRLDAAHVAPEVQKGSSEPTWDEIAPHIDEALAELPPHYREAIVLHFLQRRTQQEMASLWGISQPTVSRRIEQAVELLRERLSKRGIVVVGGVLAGMLASQSAQAVPIAVTVAMGKMAAAGIGAGSVTLATVLSAKAIVAACAACVAIVLGVVTLQGQSSDARTDVNVPSAQVPPEMQMAGQASNGLHVEIRCDTPTTTSDRQPVFHVTLKNESGHPLVIPAMDAFTKQEHPWAKEYRAQPLRPVIEQVSGKPATYSMGGNTEIAKAVPRTTVIEDGGVLDLSSVPLTQEGHVVGQEQTYQGKTSLTRNYLLPNSTYRVAFCFANQQERIGDGEIWTGKAVSNAVEITVKPAPTDHLKIEGSFEIPQKAYVMGQTITVTFKATNNGTEPFSFPIGSDYRGTGRPERFSFVAVDQAGKRVRDPVKDDPKWRPGMGGGLGSDARIAPGQTYQESLRLNQWCAFDKPGTYTVTCRRTMTGVTGLPIEELGPTIPVETILTLEIVQSDGRRR